MLFDLRSRGRRRTVQAVYLGLAILMGGGLVLFGVGAGNGFGGILNAFTGNGSGSNQKQVVSQDEQNALRAVKANPSSPQAWGSLLQARWNTAANAPDYDANTRTFTAAGKTELNGAIQAWQHYSQLTQNADPNLATLAARAYEGVGNYAAAASTWETETIGNPSEALGFECLAVNAYAAGQTRKGDLATGKVLQLLHGTAAETSTKQVLQTVKSSSQTAQAYATTC
jgi:hypothetical protein